MWTQRETTLTKIDDIRFYLEEIGAFGNFRFATFEFKKDYIRITIEENRSADNEKALVWDLTLIGVSDYFVELDCITGGLIFKVKVLINHEVQIMLTNGSLITATAAEIRLGVPNPKPQETQQ